MTDKNYFTDDELRCKGSGELKLASGFLKQLNELREICGFPFYVNSCCRNPEYNKKVGGKSGSFHLTENPKFNTCGTCAIDISIKRVTKKQLHNLIYHAARLGWSIGIDYKSKFIHLDRRVDIWLPQHKFEY